MLASFFSAIRLQVRECDAASVPSHIQLRISLVPSILLSTQDHARYAGNLQDWILAWASHNGIVDTIPRCWLNAQNGSKCQSTASRHTSVIASLPVVLRIEGSDDNTMLAEWDAPLLLRPIGKGRNTPTYSLMARVYLKTSHFTARIRWPGSTHVLSYNDLSSLGTVSHLVGSALKHLGGKQPGTQSLLYVLDGGERTQAHFATERAREVQDIFQVQVGPVGPGTDIPLALERLSYVLTRSWPNTRDYAVSSHIQDVAKALLESRSVSPEPIPPESLLQASALQPKMELIPCPAASSSSSVPGTQSPESKSTTPAKMPSLHLYHERSITSPTPSPAVNQMNLREIAKERLNAALAHPICKLYLKHSVDIPIRMSSHHRFGSETRYLPLLR